MTNQTLEQLEKKLSPGEELRQKYKVQNSDELAWRIARRMGLTDFNPYKGKEYIYPKSDQDGGKEIKSISKASIEGLYIPNFWIANRIIWAKGLTQGGDSWINGETSDIENRLKILDNLNYRERQGWLSGWQLNPASNEPGDENPNAKDGLSTWYESYAYGILRSSRRTLNCRRGSEEDFKRDLKYAIQTYQATRKISSSEKRKLRELYEEVNGIGDSNKTEERKYEPKSLTQKQWENYKRANLNPNPSITDKIHSGWDKILRCFKQGESKKYGF